MGFCLGSTQLAPLLHWRHIHQSKGYDRAPLPDSFMSTPQPAPAPAPSPCQLPRGPNFVHSLAKGLEILSAFSEGDLLGNQQLVELTGLPKATVSRLTSTLVALGYLRVDTQSRRLFMGTHVLGMGASVQRKIGLQSIARPLMQAMSEEVGLTVSLATRDRLSMVFLEVARPSHNSPLIINTDTGSILPLTNTSIGLAYIVAAPMSERTQILEGLHERYADEWTQVRERIANAHAQFLQHGFVIAEGSWGRDINGVAVPMALRERHTLYAIHCAGPASRMPRCYLEKELGPRLLTMAAQIRTALDTAITPRLVPPSLHKP